MIISHQHKFIFIKTRKTAGTSIEIALSKYCGPDDVITPLAPEDEQKRQELGYRGAQNYYIPLRNHEPLDLIRALRHGSRLPYYNHAGAAFIIKHIDRDIWDAYFKFCFERNPWDKVVSRYHQLSHAQADYPSISDFIQSRQVDPFNLFDLYTYFSEFDLYTYFSEIIVDRVFLYEQLEQSLQAIAAKLGIDEPIELPRTKAGFRKDRRSYRDVLSQSDRTKIAQVFAREIAYFGYEW
jgi:hypothetical protein